MKNLYIALLTCMLCTVQFIRSDDVAQSEIAQQEEPAINDGATEEIIDLKIEGLSPEDQKLLEEEIKRALADYNRSQTPQEVDNEAARKALEDLAKKETVVDLMTTQNSEQPVEN